MGVFMTLNEILGRDTWPPPSERNDWADVELGAAFRSSDAVRLRQEDSIPWNRRYVLTPVPRMISRVSANMLFGEAPRFTAEAEADQENLDRITGPDGNDLHAELHRAAMIASSEREVWGRIIVQPDLLDVPIIEFVSRSRVIPHFSGRFAIGATFVTEWATSRTERMRMLETYEPGAVTTRLFRGTPTRLGTEVKLNAFEYTAGRQPVVYTGMDTSLVAFIPNTIDADPCRGYSDYHGLRDRFLALNETATIGQANQRLAGRKRAIVDAGYLNDRGNLPAGDDVFIRSSRQGGDTAPTGQPLQAIDWTAGHTETIAWLDHLIDTTMTFAGVSPQSVGRGVEGGSISGTALKLRMNQSLLEAAGKGRYFDRGIRRLLNAAQIIDGRPTGEGGFGRSYVKRDGMPSVLRGDGLPRDDMEAAQQLVYLVNADAISLEERVAFLHPEWTQQQHDDEVARLRAEQQMQVPSTDLPTVP